MARSYRDKNVKIMTLVMYLINMALIIISLVQSCDSFSNPIIEVKNILRRSPAISCGSNSYTSLQMSLKPMAIPLMDSGKAFARGGELIVESTSNLGIYGGGLSAAGAAIRNSGDCIAQAAASCRFKTAGEVVIDEIREAAVCMDEAVVKLKSAVEEFETNDGRNDDKVDAELSREFGKLVESSIGPMSRSYTSMESTGAGLLQRVSTVEVSNRVIQTSEAIGELSACLSRIANEGLVKDGQTVTEDSLELSSQRINFAAEKMKEAGEKLAGVYEAPKPKGKAWLKGGGV